MGQTGAAACTTAGDNLAAVGSGHSLAEAVLLGALSWAATNGIVVGQSNQTLGPQYHMTRAETIVMLYRFCTMFGQ